MPTNQQADEKELSRLLSQAEPPRSPQHVDEAVLRYARENAPDTDRQAASSYWFINRRWIPVLATFSVAALAVSVSLQIFGPNELEQDAVATVNEAEFGLRQESVGLQAQAPVDELAGVIDANEPVETVEVEADAVVAAVAELAAVADENRLARERVDAGVVFNAEPLQDVDQIEVAALSTQDADQNDVAALSTTSAALEEEVQIATAAQPAAAPIAIRDQAVGAPQATAQSNPRRAVANTAVAGRSAFSADLAAIAVAAISEENLPNFLALLGRVLDGAPTVERGAVSGDSTPQALVARMVTLYGELVDEGALAAAEARYVTVTAGFADFELPLTLEAAVNLLRPLAD